jgi:cysteine desulfuration protein SufE
MPGPLEEFLGLLDLLPGRDERIAELIQVSRRFRPVGPEVSRPPHAEDRRVPGCESEVFVWVSLDDAGGLRLDFAVENPQGVSAMALAAILQQCFEGRDPAEAAALSPEVVERIFGRELSMGKSLGLTNLVRAVQAQSAALL